MRICASGWRSMAKTRKDLKLQWIRAYDRFKPTAGLPVGASVFDEWLELYLRSRAATMEELGLEEALQRIRRDEIAAHNRMRPMDIHWQRSIDFREELVKRIICDLLIHNDDNIESIM